MMVASRLNLVFTSNYFKYIYLQFGVFDINKNVLISIWDNKFYLISYSDG